MAEGTAIRSHEEHRPIELYVRPGDADSLPEITAIIDPSAGLSAIGSGTTLDEALGNAIRAYRRGVVREAAKSDPV